MDMEDAYTYEIDSFIKTKEIKDQATHKWGILSIEEFNLNPQVG